MHTNTADSALTVQAGLWSLREHTGIVFKQAKALKLDALYDDLHVRDLFEDGASQRTNCIQAFIDALEAVEPYLREAIELTDGRGRDFEDIADERYGAYPPEDKRLTGDYDDTDNADAGTL